MDPIQLSAAQTPATSPPAATSADQPKSPLSGAVVTIAGHKVTTHSLAVLAGLVLATVGPLVTKTWPEAAPAVEAAKQILPKTDPPSPIAPVQPTVSAYEAQIRSAWAAEKESTVGLKKAEKLARLIFLYRRGAWEAENKWSDLTDLFKSFHDEAEKLEMSSELMITRGTITAEWRARIPEKAPGPITELVRVKMSSFNHETIAILERLPQ